MSLNPLLPQKGLSYIFISLLVFTLLFLVACSEPAATDPQPPIIHYGEDVCEFCGMIISDERFAAGYLTQDGQERIFDEVGGMFQAHRKQQEAVLAFFVHDYEDVTWIRAETAHYVWSDNLTTPMLHGLVACATQEKAQALAQEVGGEVLTFDEALAHYDNE